MLIASAKIPAGKRSNFSTIKAPQKNKYLQNNVFCLAFIGFSENVHKIRIEMQINIPS